MPDWTIQLLRLIPLAGLAASAFSCRGDDVVPEGAAKAGPRASSTLVVGDSIAVFGWTEALEGVETIPENGKSSRYTRRNLDRWLEGRPRYQLILWNNGLHDARRGTNGNCNVSPRESEENLRAIAEALRGHGDRIVFLTTVLPERDGAFSTYAADVIELNDVARRVMAELAIPIIPLDEYASASDFEAPDGLHYGPEGRRGLARYIGEQIDAL